MSKPAKVIPEQVIGFTTAPQKSKFTYTDCTVYALGIGFSQDPLNTEHLNYTYDGRDDEFKVFPTNCTTITKSTDMFNSLLECPGIPDFNPMNLLHGEQECLFFKPLVVDRDYITEIELSDIADKKSGALMTVVGSSFEVNEQGGKGEKVAESRTKLFIRGIGGFGFAGKIKAEPWNKPKAAPTKVLSQTTYPNQAILYRLAGDLNPLHIDPQMAALGGFDKPILHGLCFYGVTAKLVVEGVCKGDDSMLKSFSARFSSHVFPGETLETKMWVDGARVVFETSTKERGLAVCQGVALLNTQPKL